MDITSKRFASKVLLFGEYGILFGSEALALPFNYYQGRLLFKDETTEYSLIPLAEHIEKCNAGLAIPLEIERLRADISEGLAFQSSIPVNSGLGSSGALVAAIYASYSTDSKNIETLSLEEISNDLAAIESFFHGTSSGFDPLVSLKNRPLLKSENSSVRIIEQFNLNPEHSGFCFFLYNSKLSGKTRGLVDNFIEKMKNEKFADLFIQKYKSCSDGAIHQLLNHDYSKVLQLVAELSEFQFNYMPELIPESVKELFCLGLETGNYVLKICGSGGGGHFLGLTHSFENLPESIKQNSIIVQ